MESEFHVIDTELEGLKKIFSFYREDNRGYFSKYFEQEVFKNFGLDLAVTEAFETYSVQNVIRGMHFQTLMPQDKFVRVINGAIKDVVIDLRKGSPTFGRWLSYELSGENHLGLWIPKGFAHGFRVISIDAIVSYQCFGKYLKNCDSGIRWDDADLSIDWETEDPIVSEKDKQLQSFAEFCITFGGI